ncbi:MAG: hypothetical protein F4X82_01910 [Candidatus Spechtbacteria bacterium SB0662_bin_43]|uniref:YoaR-like putative peptidoglycan binding domain-containing protein n=1 Tax=Candidatus Spechtbacteria bacterium SB0662_bin_43 TaxID=2604897 RepID=A0A845DB35_9BACT|nr:hypothetical protein [Candidatus Spechtbacteria bacterium SB0662_bin_43]
MDKKFHFKKHNRSRNKYIWSAFILSVLLLFSPLVFIYIDNRSQTAIRGVTVRSIDLHTISKQEAMNILEQQKQTFLNTNIDFRINNTSHLYPARETGVQIDIAHTLEQAYNKGRTESFLRNTITQIDAATVGEAIPLTVSINEKQFEKFINESFSDLQSQPKNATLTYNKEKDKFDIIPEQEGAKILKDALRQDIIENASRLSLDPILVQQTKQQPGILQSEIAELYNRIETILDPEFTIQSDDKSWVIPRQKIASWIIVDTTNTNDTDAAIQFSQRAIEEYLSQYSLEATKKPIDARFTIRNGEFTVVRKDEPGATLNPQASAESIIRALKNNGATAFLYTEPTYPAISRENIETLGINTLLGKGTSNFAGSPQNRAHNIQIGSSKYQGVIIAPGEEFSFNELLGSVDESTGYLPSYVIKNNKTIPEYGGGLCQVSTTLFRAALDAGLKVTARQSHSYVVRYYGTPGLDATIYPPFPDLRFQNNTENHILIQYNITGTHLSFEIYGAPQERTVYITGPVPYDIEEGGAQKTWVTQTVRGKSGNIIEEQTFYSIYKSPEDYPIERNPLE